jgi:LytTr DNA-binding domain
MIERPRYFWQFQAGFWGVTGLALFIGGLSHLPFEVALLRNIYFPIVGLLTSFFVISVLERLVYYAIKWRWIAAASTSILVSIFCTIVVNPITYTQMGNDFATIPREMIFAGVFNYALIYLLWLALYMHLDELLLQELKDQEPKINSNHTNLMLEAGGRLVPVPFDAITHIKAAGDYVEIYAGTVTHLHRSTLMALIENLDEHRFVRIHRSCVVNLTAVEALKPQSKGEFLVILKDDNALKVSRTFAANLETQLRQLN